MKVAHIENPLARVVGFVLADGRRVDLDRSLSIPDADARQVKDSDVAEVVDRPVSGKKFAVEIAKLTAKGGGPIELPVEQPAELG